MPQKALLINSLSAGGAEKVISVILTELTHQCIEVELICLEKDDFYTIPEKVKITYLSNFTGKENGLKKLLYIPFFAWKLKQYCDKNEITLVQSHLYRANYINILSRLLNGFHKTQVVTHGIVSTTYEGQGLYGKINLFLTKHLFSRADLLITISSAMKEDMNRLFNFKNKQVVINNPYDIDNIEYLASKELNDFIFKKNKVYLINIGRIIPIKRIQDILLAIKELPEYIELIVLGEGKEKDKALLIQLAKDINVINRIHFLGRVSNPFKYLSRANILILASETEGFPNVLVESMICGTPIISTDCLSGPREILAPTTAICTHLKNDIEKAEYGVLFPVGDIKSLIKAINLLINDNMLTNNYIYESKKRATDFSVKKIIYQYKKVMEIE